MQGQYMPGNIEIALDLTEYMTEEGRGGEHSTSISCVVSGAR